MKANNNVAGKRHEIATRYGWCGKNVVPRVRIKELFRLLDHRYGGVFPDDDGGRDDLLILASHLAGDTPNWHDIIRRWAPWLTDPEFNELVRRIGDRPKRYLAQELGKLLRLTGEERAGLRITTIRAFDVTPQDMAESRKSKAREREQRRRRAAGAKSQAHSNARRKPWDSAGISESTWYRRRKAARDSASCAAKGVSVGAQESQSTIPTQGEAFEMGTGA